MIPAAKAQSLRFAIVFFVIFAAVCCVYRSVPSFSKVSIDDDLHVFQNVSPPSRYWRGIEQGLYIPVTYSFWDALKTWHRFFSDTPPSPALFHSVNALLHAVNGCLVFTILFRLFGWGALAGAGLFLLHPLQTEAVSWISGAKDLLATFFALSALAFHELRRRPGHRVYSALRSLFWVLAMLSKPSMVILGVFFPLWDFALKRLSLPRAIFRALPLAILAVPVILINRSGQPYEILESITPLHLRPQVMIDSFIFYLSKLAFPFSLSFDYGRTPEAILQAPKIWTELAALVVLGALLSRRMFTLTFFFIFLLLLLPTSGLAPFYFQKYSTVADRYVYFALIVPAVLLSSLMMKPNFRPRLYLAGILAGFAVLSFTQSQVWANDISLYRRIVSTNPNAVNCFNLASFLEAAAGGRESTELSEEIEGNYRRSLAANPKYSKAFHNLGVRELRAGRSERAERFFRSAIAAAPFSAIESYNNLGVLLGEAGRYDEAIELFRSALALNPRFTDAIRNLTLAEGLRK